jgi:phosphatidylglycerophosphatase A
MKLIQNLILTFGGLGKLPTAPGTWGSIGALLVWLVVPQEISFRICLILLFSILGYYFCSVELIESEDKDPSYIVIDEVIGMWISLLFVQTINLMIIGLILFRFFDIFKPSIIYHSQFFNGAVGVILDDVIAGIFVSLILIGIIV